MVRGEPVQTVYKPPQLNNVVQTSFNQGIMLHKSHPGLPSKQALIPTKQVMYSNTQPPPYHHQHQHQHHHHTTTQSYMDYANTTKYAELFINPPLNAHMYTFDEAPVPAYPLDTVIPNYPVPQKMSPSQQDTLGHFTHMAKKSPHSSELENLLTTNSAAKTAVSPSTELENMIKFSTDTDFTSLFSTFAPSNGDPSESGGPGDFAIPSTSATGIFDSFPADFFQDSSSPPNTQSVDMAWRMTGEQNFVGNQPAPPPTNESVDSSPPSSFWIPSSSSALTPLLEAFPSLDNDLPLPTPSSLSPPTTSHAHTLAVSPTRTPNSLTGSSTTPPSNDEERGEGLNYQQEQLDFFEDTLDWDSILPPSKRLQEFPPPSHSEASSPVSHMHISPAPTPFPPSSPPSPVETKPELLPPSTPSESSKSSPLLFGKTEDEILLKVIVLRSNSKPVTRGKLVSMPVEEFNRLLDVAELNEIEVAFMKEWRRRGKNKTAAMVARKRKRDELTDLDGEVEQLRKQKAGLRSKCDRLQAEISALKEKSRAAEDRVYQRYVRQSGVPVSRKTHVIHVDKTGKVLLGPRPSSQQMLLVK